MAVIATGFFDGVHLGHRRVVEALVSFARRTGGEAVVVTFAQHPRAVLQQDARSLRLLTSAEEKEAMLYELGVDRVETLPFDRAFARLTASEYIYDVLIGRFDADGLVLGYDNRFGSDRLTPDRIAPIAESLGLEVLVVPPVVTGAVETAAASENRSHPRLRKREGPADEVSGRGPASPDVFGGWLPRNEGRTKEFEVSEEVYAKIAMREGTEGVIAEVRMPERRLEDLPLPRNPLVVVLERVEKPGNLGAVLRSADAAGADAVLVCDPLTDLWNPNLIRASVGAVFTVPCAACSSAEAIAFLKARGIRILTAQLQDSSLYYDCDMTVGTALVMGTESTGLTGQWREAADAHIRIPMLGRLDSLNVSVSAAILLFEAVRQRQHG
jgi:TrmH family RNA methyltransferase